MNVRFYLFVYVVDQGNEGWRQVQDFLIRERGGVIQCMLNVCDDQANGGWFLFCQAMFCDVTLGNGCGV